MRSKGSTISFWQLGWAGLYSSLSMLVEMILGPYIGPIPMKKTLIKKSI